MFFPLAARCRFLALAALTFGLSCLAASAQPLAKDVAQADSGIAWHDVRQLTVEGRGWGEKDLKEPFDRLPAKAEGKVRPAVWSLSRDSAGLCIRFASDS